jgi:hypothetical protein
MFAGDMPGRSSRKQLIWPWTLQWWLRLLLGENWGIQDSMQAGFRAADFYDPFTDMRARISCQPPKKRRMMYDQLLAPVCPFILHAIFKKCFLNSIFQLTVTGLLVLCFIKRRNRNGYLVSSAGLLYHFLGGCLIIFYQHMPLASWNWDVCAHFIIFHLVSILD